MSGILSRLSSQQNDRSENSNRSVAEYCSENPVFLREIADGFKSKDGKLISDCIEVFTMVAEKKPQLIAPFFHEIIELIKNKDSKTRWESVHTLSFITVLVPDDILTILQDIGELIEKEKSVIVRDYSLDIISRYAGTGEQAAKESYPILTSALEMWQERHAKQVFEGFLNVLGQVPSYKSDIRRLAVPFTDCHKKVAANLAKRIIKLTENDK